MATPELSQQPPHTYDSTSAAGTPRPTIATVRRGLFRRATLRAATGGILRAPGHCHWLHQRSAARGRRHREAAAAVSCQGRTEGLKIDFGVPLGPYWGIWRPGCHDEHGRFNGGTFVLRVCE